MVIPDVFQVLKLNSPVSYVVSYVLCRMSQNALMLIPFLILSDLLFTASLQYFQ